MGMIDSRVYYYRLLNFMHQVAASLGLLICFIFSEFANFQRTYTGETLAVEPLLQSEVLIFTFVLGVCVFASSMMHYVSDPRSNTRYFGIYLLFAIAACLLSFFSVAHIWTLLQIIRQRMESEERALEVRFFGWYFYRLFILAISFCFTCGCSLVTLLMYRSVKESVHRRHKEPNFRYVNLSHA